VTDDAHVLEQVLDPPYEHSTGPVLGRYLSALPTLLARRCRDCERVVIPPGEVCGVCGGEMGEWTEVGPGGTVRAAAAGFELFRPDGADTDLVRQQRCVDFIGHRPMKSTHPVVGVRLRLPVRQGIGLVESRFQRAVADGRLEGNRCPVCAAVYCPPRPSCPRCWVACEDWVEVADTGTVEMFVVVNVPFTGQEVQIPYVLANIRLDGADTTLYHLVDAPVDSVRTGMRVRAVWRPDDQRQGLVNDDIDRFVPEEEA
jgi:uncharacterized OB-fold protein